jgi:hypothetical protein
LTGDGVDARRLAPGGGEGLVVEGACRLAALAEASSGGECAGSGGVVDLAGGSEGSEVFAGGGFGDAELAGKGSQGEGTAASSAFPPDEELQGVEGGRRVAPGASRGAQAGELGGFGAELAVEAGGDLKPVSPAERSAWIGGVEVVFESDQGDVLDGVEVAEVGQVAQGAGEVAQGADENALNGLGSDGRQEAAEAVSPAFREGSLVNAMQRDVPASRGRVGGQGGEDVLDGLLALVGRRGARVEGD